MDPELKRELAEIHALAKDNNRMLRAIRREAWIGFFLKVALWAVIIGVPIYFYQTVLKPEIEEFRENPQGAALNVFGLPSSTEIQKLIDSYKAGLK